MHSHSWRLLTAGHLHLDGILRDLPSAQGDQLEIIRDATLCAFEQLVEVALEKSVDLLLLTGTVCTEAPGVRACTTFRDGIEALLEEGIAVAWSPVDLQEVETLRKLDCLPEGLTVLKTEGGQDRIEINTTRKNSLPDSEKILGGVCCEIISPAQSSRQTKQNPNRLDADTVCIGISRNAIGQLCLMSSEQSHGLMSSEQPSGDEHYSLIISGEAERQQTTRHRNTLYHAPGVLQALTDQIVGLCCATLIEIDSSGDIELHPVPTCAVFYERIAMVVQQEESLEELLERAELELLELLSDQPSGPAKLLQLCWEVRGPHPLLMQFSSQELLEFFSTLQPLEEMSILHEVVLAPQLTGEGTQDRNVQEDDVSEQFLRLLGEKNSNKAALNIKDLQQNLGSDSLPVDKLLEQMPHNKLCHRAAELGLLALQEKLLDAG